MAGLVGREPIACDGGNHHAFSRWRATMIMLAGWMKHCDVMGQNELN
jgi:hypothetical protein